MSIGQEGFTSPGTALLIFISFATSLPIPFLLGWSIFTSLTIYIARPVKATGISFCPVLRLNWGLSDAMCHTPLKCFSRLKTP